MNVSSREVNGVTVVDMSGRITLGEGGVVLRDTIHDLLDKGNKKILLNLGNVTYIDSSGIGELITAFTAVRKQGGRSQAAQPYEEGPGPASDHETLYRFRYKRRRSYRHQRIQRGSFSCCQLTPPICRWL